MQDSVCVFSALIIDLKKAFLISLLKDKVNFGLKLCHYCATIVPLEGTRETGPYYNCQQ